MSEQTQWWYIKQQQRLGPVSVQELKQLAAVGEITPETLIWKTGMAQWVTAARAEGLFHNHSAVTQPSPSPLFAWSIVALLAVITVAVTLFFTLSSPNASKHSSEQPASAAKPSPPEVLRPSTSAMPVMPLDEVIAPVEPVAPIAPVAVAVAANSIPSQFHGEWEKNTDWCNSDYMEGFDIKSKGYGVYEGYCELVNVIKQDELSFSANFRCSDLDVPNENLSLVNFILRDTNKLSSDNITYHKCPSR
jgi:hypothetical protein